MDLALERFNRQLDVAFGDSKSEFVTTLQESRALVSGSSVLKAIIDGDWKDHDIDIYVNIRDSSPLAKFLIKNNSIIGNKMNTVYSQNFLTENRIFKIITFRLLSGFNVDLVLVHNEQPLVDVIKNFDLSCCMNYYNGKKIVSLRYDSIKERKMYLSPCYYRYWHYNNKITHGRVRKYIERGFLFVYEKDVIVSRPSRDIKLLAFQYLLYSCVFKNYFYTGNISEFSRILYTRIEAVNGGAFRTTVLVREVINGIEYDPCELLTYDDYKKIGKGEEFLKVIDKIMNTHDSGFDSIHEKVINLCKIPDARTLSKDHIDLLKNLTCFDEVEFKEVSVSEFLSSHKEHIVIRFNDKITGYRRNNIMNFCINRKKVIDSIEVCQLYSGQKMLQVDTKKLSFESVMTYKLINSGFKLSDELIYTLVPCSIEEFCK